MRYRLFWKHCCSIGLALAVSGHLVHAQDDPSRKPNLKAGAPKSPDASAKTPPRSKADAKGESEKETRDREEKAIRATGEGFVHAFNSADVSLISAFFSEDAEYVDVAGTIYEGRGEIEEVFRSCFDEMPGSKLEMTIERIRIVATGVAIEDGKSLILPAEGTDAIETRYSAIHIKHGDQWLVASVREQSVGKAEPHRLQLKQLEWLQGNWVDECDDAVVIFSCSPIDEGNFLLRKFSIHIAGEPALTGEQRIGWDPLHRKLRTWIFDSEGGFSEGFWFRDDQRWLLKCVGVTESGQTASSTTIYQRVDDNTMTWQAVDHEVDGVQLPDSDPITIVRRSPLPEAETGAAVSLRTDSK